uniref:Putative secreted protein n=1 Tax=Xenopsylla cheopis TaxID=163159 RepID=A0A6M2DVX9_XENCH
MHLIFCIRKITCRYFRLLLFSDMPRAKYSVPYFSHNTFPCIISVINVSPCIVLFLDLILLKYKLHSTSS